MPSEDRDWMGVFRPGPDAEELVAHRDALEPAVLEAFAARKPSVPRRRPWLRIALAGLLAVGVGVGACQIPTEYELPLGNRIGIVLPAGKMAQIDPEEIGRFVERNFPAEGMMMRVEIEDAGDGEPMMRIGMELIGPDIDVDAVWDELLDAYPALDGGRVEGEVLEGVVHGTWGGRLGKDLFDLSVDGGDIEEAKLRLLQELQERGIDGDAQITVEEEQTDHGIERRIEVRVQSDEHVH